MEHKVAVVAGEKRWYAAGGYGVGASGTMPEYLVHKEAQMRILKLNSM